MSPKDRITLLQHWERVAKDLNRQMGKLDSILEPYVESPLGKAIWTTLDAYTDTLATLVGDNDGWLGWYHCENGWGEKELVAKARTRDKLRPIRNIRDLARLIERSQLTNAESIHPESKP